MNTPNPLKTKTTTKPKGDHHHGDLKNALINAGLALLEDGGMDGLSLRKCAAKAGVSHAAPAHHFDGLAGLKAAIADRAFEIFADNLAAAVKTAGDDDLDRLKAICHGYLNFGVAHPGLLSIIFARGGLGAHTQHHHAGPHPAYRILQNVCAPFQRDDVDPRILETQVWSLAHGFTQLTMGFEFGTPEHVLEQGYAYDVFAALERLVDRPASRT